MKVFAVAVAMCALLAGCDQMPEQKPDWYRDLPTEEVGNYGLFAEHGAIFFALGDNFKEQSLTVSNLTEDKLAVSIYYDLQHLDKDKGLLRAETRGIIPFKPGQTHRHLIHRVKGRKSFKISNVKVIWKETD